MFTEDPIEGGITYEKGGRIKVSDAIGLGAFISEDYLKKLEKIHIH